MKNLTQFLLWPVIAGILVALGLIYLFPESSYNDPLSQVDKTHTPPSWGPVSYAQAVRRAAPAVVNIYTTKIIQPRTPNNFFDDPFFRRFFGQRALPENRMQSSLGSGVLTSQNGVVLTNHHVVSTADEIIIALQDGRETQATLLGTDPESDLAVLKINLPDLPSIPFADSDRAQVGDVVLAIGNPFGFGQTVTMGIISATGRTQLGLTTFEDFIQTDAAINRGNSGGALTNAYGELVGINTAIFSESGGSVGIGFAIPSNLVRKVLQDILTHGQVIRGWLGIEIRNLTTEDRENLGLKTDSTGLVVAGLYSNGPAFQAGLQFGDVINQINQQPITQGIEAMNKIARMQPGEEVQLGFWRNGQQHQTVARVGTRPINNATGE